MKATNEKKEISPEVERVAERVLDTAFHGIHHVEHWHRRKARGSSGLEVSTGHDLSTFDGDYLTRLVVAAHDECVRLTIEPSGRGMLKLVFFPRVRDGRMFERHDTMETAIVKVRK